MMVELADIPASVAQVEPAVFSPEIPAAPWIERSTHNFGEVWIDGRAVSRAGFLAAVGDVLEGNPQVGIESKVMIRIPQAGEEDIVRVNEREMPWREFVYGTLDVVMQRRRGTILDDMQGVLDNLAWDHFADYLALAPPRPGLYSGVAQKLHEMAREERAKA